MKKFSLKQINLSRPLVQNLILVTLILIFWFPILFNNGFFYDDFGFINKIKAGTAVSDLFTPENGHFAPLGKTLFLGLYSLFGQNIVPFMVVSLIMQTVTGLLALWLLRLIFPKRPFLPFYLSLFFCLTTVYFEILHWFSALGQAFPFLFLMLTLILFHHSVKNNDRRLYYWALAASFLIPVNYLLGFLGIVFIVLYYWLILKPQFPQKTRHAWPALWPFIAVWLAFLAVYLFFCFTNITHEVSANHLFSVNPIQIASFTLYGLVGLVIRNLGFTPLIFPYTSLIAALLALVFVVLAVFLFLYFILNLKANRVPLFKGKTVAFGFFSMLTVYLVLAAGRQAVGIMAFIGWGRYHYLPQFFLTIMVGAIVPQIELIFSRLFNPRRFKIFLVVLLAVLLLNHFILIRQKTGDTVRTEGALPGPTLQVAA